LRTETNEFLAIRRRIRYTEEMAKDDKIFSKKELGEATARRHAAAHLQALEGNPLDAADIAMFEMFERERWPHERRLAYIRERA